MQRKSSESGNILAVNHHFSEDASCNAVTVGVVTHISCDNEKTPLNSEQARRTAGPEQRRGLLKDGVMVTMGKRKSRKKMGKTMKAGSWSVSRPARSVGACSVAVAIPCGLMGCVDSIAPENDPLCSGRALPNRKFVYGNKYRTVLSWGCRVACTATSAAAAAFWRVPGAPGFLEYVCRGSCHQDCHERKLPAHDRCLTTGGVNGSSLILSERWRAGLIMFRAKPPRTQRKIAKKNTRHGSLLCVFHGDLSAFARNEFDLQSSRW
jgi:hypothetical protein